MCDFTCGVIFNVSDKLFGFPSLFLVCYLPPHGSSFYKGMHSNGITILEDTLLTFTSTYPDHKIILSGDFNARTKDMNDFILDDSPEYIPLPDDYPEDVFNVPRKSKDHDLNEYGKLC